MASGKPLAAPLLSLSCLDLQHNLIPGSQLFGPCQQLDCTILIPKALAAGHAVMKLAHFTIGLLALVSPVAAAWSKEGQSQLAACPNTIMRDHPGLSPVQRPSLNQPPHKIRALKPNNPSLAQC